MRRRSRWLSVALVYALLFSPLAAAAGKHRRPVHSLWEMPPAASAVHRAAVFSRMAKRLPERPTLWNEPYRVATLSPDEIQAAPTVTIADRWPFNSRPTLTAEPRPRPGLRQPTPLNAERYRALVTAHAARFGLPPALILAVIHAESGFQPTAVSPKDAVGLMQLVPDKGGAEALRYVTGDTFAPPPTRQQLYDPEFNILLGTAYLRWLLDESFADIIPWEVRKDLVLAAYNWGHDRVRRHLVGQQPPVTVAEVWERLERKAPLETRRYVQRVNECLNRYEGMATLSPRRENTLASRY
ncbi:MAG: transglycosylase SLT domain-containing protein [Candidatus Competibacteraceae bacterium]